MSDADKKFWSCIQRSSDVITKIVIDPSCSCTRTKSGFHCKRTNTFPLGYCACQDCLLYQNNLPKPTNYIHKSYENKCTLKKRQKIKINCPVIQEINIVPQDTCINTNVTQTMFQKIWSKISRKQIDSKP